jgi:hypothetical protein
MAEGLKRFGETGFNTADKLESLGVAQEDFTRKVGQGINQSKEFQSVLGSLSDAVFSLVKGFNPAPITAFVDLLVKGAKSIGSAFLKEFPSIKTGLDTLLNDTKGSVTNLTNFIIDASYGVVRQIASAANLVVDILQGLNIGNIFSKAVQTISLVVGTMVEGVAKGISALINVVLTGFDNMILGIVQLADKFPSISEALGIDSNELNGLADSMNNIRESVTTGLDSIGNSAFEAGKSVALGLDDFNKNAEKYKISISGIEQAQADAKKGAEALLKGGAIESGKIEVILPETELDKLKNFKADLSTEINIGLDAGKSGTKQAASDGLDENSVLAALVKLLLSALSGAAAAEGIPIAVSA